MSPARLIHITLLTAFVLTCISAQGAAARDQTAKAALPQVLETAKKWQGDAILVHLSSVKVQPGGTSPEWEYSFYSPATQKRCVVRARSGSVTTEEVLLGNYTEPLGEFLDSDKAMEEAKKWGLKGSETSMSVARSADAKAHITSWLVTGRWKDGEISLSLDAKTGALTKRTVIETEDPGI